MFFFRYWKRPLKLHELLEEIDNIDNETPSDIIIFPPENANEENTDEDSGDEDTVDVNNLPGGQLRGQVEVLVPADPETGVQMEESDSDEDLPLSTYGPRVVGSRVVKKTRIYNWTNNDMKSNLPDFPPMYGPKQMYTPIEAFSLFFDNEVIDMLVNYSNMYANSHNRNGDISDNEFRCFLGVLLLSGYSSHPRRSMYWENSKDTNNILVCDAISRNRFNFIIQNIHCCDNSNLDQTNKFAKLRPLFDALKKRFIDMSPYQESHSIDESMVPYFGHHGSKQFIKGKPIRWGYKLWTGTTVNGYIEWFEPYQGSTTMISDKYKALGLGASVVLEFADVLQCKYPGVSFHLYFDNFFTSLHLLEELKIMRLKGTGTMRENRVGRECPLPHSTVMKNRERGSLEFITSDTNCITICKWCDNNVVTIATNFNTVLPTMPVKRFSQKEKKNIYVPQPQVVKKYNESMGGVDRADQNISLYRTQIRGKKWYFPLICHSLDMALQNAWQLYRIGGGKKDHLRFRQSVALSMLETYKKSSKRGPTRQSANLHETSRYDRLDHLVVYQEKQTRCNICHKNCNFFCQKCAITLHPKNCFLTYHTM